MQTDMRAMHTDGELDGMHMVLRRAALSLIHDVKALEEGDRRGARHAAEAAGVLGGVVLVHGDAADAATAVPAHVTAGRRAALDSLRHAIAALSALAAGLTCVPWEGAQVEAVDAAMTFGRRLDDHLSAREQLAMPVHEDRVLVAV